MMTDPNGTKFTVEVPYTRGRPHFKFKEDSFSHSRDTSNQTFKNFFVFALALIIILFAHFAKITITRVCMLQSG